MTQDILIAVAGAVALAALYVWQRRLPVGTSFTAGPLEVGAILLALGWIVFVVIKGFVLATWLLARS